MEILAQLGVDQTFWIQLVLFLTCYFFMSQFLFKPYLRNLDYRKKNTTEAVEEAQKLMTVTDSLAMEYEGKVKKQNEEALHIYTKFKQDGVAEEQKLIATARTKAEKVVYDTNLKISLEIEQTKKELAKMIPEISRQAATKILGRNLVLILAISAWGAYSLASGPAGEHGHAEGGVPSTVYFQALNFFGILFILGFFLRKKIVGFFDKRHEELKLAVEESRRMRREVQKRHEDYTVKIQSIDKLTQEVLQKISQEGQQARERIISEAQKAAQLIEAEAHKTVEAEITKAKKQLIQDTLDASLSGAKELLKENIKEQDQRKFQDEFTKKIGLSQ